MTPTVEVDLRAFSEMMQQLEDMCSVGIIHWTSACSIIGNFLSNEMYPNSMLDMLVSDWIDKMHERWSR